MEITPQHWGIIINPKSGKKKYRHQRKELFLVLKHHAIPFDYRVTRFAGHASKIARSFVESNYKNILVLGGDGTMSEVINGCYSGGGLKQTPNALPYDGLLDVMIARKPTFLKIIGALSFLFRGKLLEHSLIDSFQTTDLYIQCDKKALLEADGIIVNGSSPFTISILPQAIQMIVP